MTKKTCTKCGVSKPLSGFYRQSATKDGLTTSCKECISAAKKIYREKNKIRIKKTESEYYLRNKDKIKRNASEWRANNKDRFKRWQCEYKKKNNENNKKWCENNPIKVVNRYVRKYHGISDSALSEAKVLQILINREIRRNS